MTNLIKRVSSMAAIFLVAGLVLGAEGCDLEETGTGTTQNEKEVQEVTPDPIKLSGIGQQATKPVPLKQGLSIFKMSHNGGSNFAIQLLDSNGDLVDLLVNEVGAFNGSKAVQVSSEGSYVLDVTADGSWNITIEQPRNADVPPKAKFSGQGQQATGLFRMESGLKTFKMSHQGTSNFAVVLMDSRGNMVDLLVNEIGSFNGSKATKVPDDGAYVFDVTASGPWSITVQ